MTYAGSNREQLQIHSIFVPNTYITTYLDTIIHDKKLGKSSKHPLVLGEHDFHRRPILAVVTPPSPSQG